MSSCVDIAALYYIQIAVGATLLRYMCRIECKIAAYVGQRIGGTYHGTCIVRDGQAFEDAQAKALMHRSTASLQDHK